MKLSTSSATVKVGIEIIHPYFINVLNENSISCLWTKSVNIIPAKAPTGVKNAPKFEPIIVLYIAC